MTSLALVNRSLRKAEKRERLITTAMRMSEGEFLRLRSLPEAPEDPWTRFVWKVIHIIDRFNDHMRYRLMRTT